jgi:DeoR/GlpR family transcriptional regulator of sugar metabolism|tara:strand:- start:11631 stop:12410 length:780 start_codon:yes stop_codon:yes gene_type:complete
MTEVENKYLASERREQLRKVIAEKGAARIGLLCEMLDSSPATVRRDLQFLHDRGIVERVHGGALSVGRGNEEPPFNDKASIYLSEKRKIAHKAASIIESEDTVYLDGGSTTLQLARLISDRKDLTVVTNSFKSALEFSESGCRLILVGGEFRRRSQTIVGALTSHVLGNINVDKAFMGTMGFSRRHGLTTTEPNESYTKKLAVSRAQKVYLLADSHKGGKVFLSNSGGLESIDVLITDKGLSKDYKIYLRELGVEVRCV